MKTPNKIFLIYLLIISSILIAGCGQEGENDDVSGITESNGSNGGYIFGGGSQGGTWFTAVGGAVTELDTNIEEAEFSYGASAGSPENVRRIAQGEYDTGFAHINTLYDAWEGENEFDGRPTQNFQIVAQTEHLTHIWYTLESNEDIYTVSDLEGKRVNMGSPGSGSNVHAHQIIETLGLDINDENLDFSAGSRGLLDRQMDASVAVGNPYTSAAIDETATQSPIRYVEFTNEEIEILLGEHPYYEEITIPEDETSLDEDVQGLSYAVYWIAHEDMPSEIVYKMLEVVEENRGSLVNIDKAWEDLSTHPEPLSDMDGITFHEGAIQYWEDKGEVIPEEFKK